MRIHSVKENLRDFHHRGTENTEENWVNKLDVLTLIELGLCGDLMAEGGYERLHLVCGIFLSP